jgi:hypothetical protein
MSGAAADPAGLVAHDADVIIVGARKSNKFPTDACSANGHAFAKPKVWDSSAIRRLELEEEIMRPIRHLAAVTVAVLIGGGAALAQSAPPPPTAPEAQALTIDTPIEVVTATPKAKAVLDADIPGLTEHPLFDKFKSDSLRALAPKFGGAISDKDLAKVQADLAALSLTTTSR